MHKFFSVAALAAVSLLLGACGGSSFSASSSGGGGGTTTPPATAASLTVTSDVMSIPSDGSSGANITVIAKDSNSAVVSGIAVSFSANNGGNVTATQGTTDSTGTAKATLVVGTAAAGATITVTATSGTVTGTTSVTVSNAKKTLTLLTSSPSIPSDNSLPATISAIVKDANNNLLAGVPVSFQVTSGAVVAVQTKAGATANVAAGTTDANGLAQASVTTPGDPSNRTITVNATAGTATAQVDVGVSGSNVTLSGPPTLVTGNMGNFSVVVTDASGQGIPNVTVTVSSANGNTLSASSLTTDANGRATFNLTATKAGSDTITATAIGITKTATVSVSAQSFNITAPADQTNVNLGTQQLITVTWTNNNAPVVGQTVTFASTRGTVTPVNGGMTDANGHATANVSSTSAGSAIVQATASSSGTTLSSQVGLNFVATTPSQIAVQAGPTSVPIQGQSTITATVRDAQLNLVPNVTVDFQIVTDPSNGALSVASAVTNSLGQAQTVYTAGATSSGANAVTLSATVAAAPTITASTNLTVGGQAVGLSFGTGNTVDTSQGTAIYQVTYTVLAVDSHGAPLPNQPISFSVLPVAYGKGKMTGCPGGQNWVPTYNTLTTDTHAYRGQTMCTNEDTDYTGNIASLDSGTPGTCTNLLNSQTITSHVKDYNCNGVLDPGSVATAAPISGNTDANGRLDVKVTYPRDHAYWTEVQLIASTTVQGTQSSTSVTFVLLGAISDYACATSPPGFISPYGQAATCANPN